MVDRRAGIRAIPGLANNRDLKKFDVTVAQWQALIYAFDCKVS